MLNCISASRYSCNHNNARLRSATGAQGVGATAQTTQAVVKPPTWVSGAFSHDLGTLRSSFVVCRNSLYASIRCVALVRASGGSSEDSTRFIREISCTASSMMSRSRLALFSLSTLVNRCLHWDAARRFLRSSCSKPVVSTTLVDCS